MVKEFQENQANEANWSRQTTESGVSVFTFRTKLHPS